MTDPTQARIRELHTRMYEAFELAVACGDDAEAAGKPEQALDCRRWKAIIGLATGTADMCDTENLLLALPRIARYADTAQENNWSAAGEALAEDLKDMSQRFTGMQTD